MDENCLFCRMSSGALTVDKVFEDEQLFAIKDINPLAPTHIMVIPREHIPSAAHLDEGRGPLVTHLLATANEIARDQGISESGYRLVFNVGDDGGQSIYHLHLHLLGGRELGPSA